KTRQDYSDVLDRSRQVLDMAVRNGTVAMRCHPDVDTIQGLIGVETLVHLRNEYAQGRRISISFLDWPKSTAVTSIFMRISRTAQRTGVLRQPHILPRRLSIRATTGWSLWGT